jgi:hypothetical protein
MSAMANGVALRKNGGTPSGSELKADRDAYAVMIQILDNRRRPDGQR